MALPVSFSAISLSNFDRQSAPSRVIDPVVKNTGAPRVATFRATGGEILTDKPVRLSSVPQAVQSENSRLDLPAGPTPAFEESILERRARVALETKPFIEAMSKAPQEGEDQKKTARSASPPATRQAEAAVKQTRALEVQDAVATIDLRG